MMTRRYQKRQRRRVLVGFAYTYVGLVLFLCGVNVGFMTRRFPAGGHRWPGGAACWLLVPIGMLIGFYIVKAEPAVAVPYQAGEEVSNGSITIRPWATPCLSAYVCQWGWLWFVFSRALTFSGFSFRAMA